jgi:hypothetical protein
VSPAGIEPATLCLEGRCSIQLSYGLLNVIVAAPDLEKKTESATRARVAQPPPAVRIPVLLRFGAKNGTPAVRPTRAPNRMLQEQSHSTTIDTLRRFGAQRQN